METWQQIEERIEREEKEEREELLKRVEEEAKPCPFCGGKAEVYYDSEDQDLIVIACSTDCLDGNPVIAGYDHKEILEKWNRRPNNEKDTQIPSGRE